MIMQGRAYSAGSNKYMSSTGVVLVRVSPALTVFQKTVYFIV